MGQQARQIFHTARRQGSISAVGRRPQYEPPPSRMRANISHGAMNERLSPHPVLLPASSPWRACISTCPHPPADADGEGTLRQLYSFENYARSLRQRPLSQGERDRVRGDTAVMLAPMRESGDPCYMYVRTLFLACMDSRLRGNDAEFAIRRQVLARTFAPVTKFARKPLRGRPLSRWTRWERAGVRGARPVLSGALHSLGRSHIVHSQVRFRQPPGSP
jgi:hypothetical protein